MLKCRLVSNLTNWLHYYLIMGGHRLVLDLGLLESGVCLLKLRMLCQMLIRERVVEIFIAFTNCEQNFTTFIAELGTL